MNNIAIFSKKQFFISTFIGLLIIGSYGIFKFYLHKKNDFVKECLAKSYKLFQINLQTSWKSLDDYGQDYVHKTNIVSSHQITQTLHPSIVKAFFITTDLTQIPIDLKNDPEWKSIESIINLSTGTTSKTNSPIFKEKNELALMWLCTPVYSKDKLIGYIVGKKTFGSEFSKNKILSFFLVQELIPPISLSEQAINTQNIPPLTDNDTFDETNFMSPISSKEALTATQFDSELTIGFVAIYPLGKIYVAFKLLVTGLFFILFLLWIRTIITIMSFFWEKIHYLFMQHRITITPFLCLLLGGLALHNSIKIHHIIKKTKILLQNEHAYKNVALAQKINTACLLAPNKIADKETVLKTLSENTPTKIESLFITDSTNKIICKYSQTHKVYQEILCKIIGISNATYKIEIPNWTLHSTYAISYQELPLQKFRSAFILFIIFLILFIISCWYTYQILLEKKFNRWLIITLSLLGLCNITLWGIINYIPVTYFDSTNTIKTPADNSLLIAKADIIAGNRQMLPPIRTQLGLELQNLDVGLVNKAIIQGKIWQIAPKVDDIGIIIANEQDTKIDEINRTESAKEQKILWRLFSKITTPDEYRGYPFSVKHVKIAISSQNLQKPTLLIPDPTLLQLDKTPWLSKNIETPGFTLIEHSITSEFPPNEAIKSVVQGFSNSLLFNLSFRESLVGALFTYIFPLFIILLAIFGILWVPDTVRFTAYSGVFFADILLHRTLRGSLNLVQVCYLDCFFFYTYLALIMLMCGTLIVLSKPAIKELIDDLCKKTYWPIQLVLWLVTTAWFFC